MMKKLYKNWFVHNVFAHPLMYFIGFISKRAANAVHDSTLPPADKA